VGRWCPCEEILLARLDKESRRIAEAIEAVERFLQQVNTEYEMYFLGIVRRAPEE
jgi:cytochrome c peroxidase